jgi:hypothetical protein
MKERVSRRRLGGAAIVALGAVLVFAAIGGTGLAGGLAKPGKAQYAPGQYTFSEKKVTVCHKGKVTIRISVNALPAHRSHGDSMGLCPALAAAKAKAAKAAESDDQSGETDTSAAGHGKGNGKANGSGKGSANANGKSNGNGNGKK